MATKSLDAGGMAAAPTGALDWRQVDWPRVGRAVYQVRQRYQYTYTAPVNDLRQQLMVVPPDQLADQRLIEHELTVRGSAAEPTISWYVDRFDNRVCRVHVNRVPEMIEFIASYRVERSTPPLSPHTGGMPSSPCGTAIFLEPTALTTPDARLHAAAALIARGATDELELAERAHEWASRAIIYQVGMTGVQTPAAMALHLGKGVCQDYAHILLCVLRMVGVPARYVSGHLLGEGAPHAWVEALVEDPSSPWRFAVIGYDPTNRRRVGMNYIRVAIGRDYADIRPTGGVFTGPASGRLIATKQAEVCEVVCRSAGDDMRDPDSRPSAQPEESVA